MSEELDRLRNELATWHLGLDERSKTFFDAVYAQDARILVTAMGGADVSADEIGAHATLAALLGTDGASAAGDVVPYIAISRQPTVEPEVPTAGTPFSLRWAETNSAAVSWAMLMQPTCMSNGT